MIRPPEWITDKAQGAKGDVDYRAISQQFVLFCVERRKAWRGPNHSQKNWLGCSKAKQAS
jgi:hypothetical protein